jgi:hypothetical protein
LPNEDSESEVSGFRQSAICRIDTASIACSIERTIDLIPWACCYSGIVVVEYPHSHRYFESGYKMKKMQKLAPICIMTILCS